MAESKRGLGIAVGLLVAGLVGCAQPRPATRAETHQALLETFFPAEDPSLSADERAHFQSLRDFAPLSRDAGLKRDLSVLAGEGWVSGPAHPAAEQGPALRALNEKGFAALSAKERESALQELFAHPDPRARALARRLRSVYLGLIYGSALGPLLVGDPSLAPPASSEVKVPPLSFPHTRLRFDPQTQTLTHQDGPFEFLIVGSGPAGSVLANRLTLAGRRVLLIERGPFVIPGAIDTRSRSALMESGNRRTSLDGSVVIRNGSAVGGGSTVNIDLAFDPTQPRLMRRIQAWVQQGRLEAEQTSPERLRAAYAWVKERMGTRALSEDEINANNRVLWTGALARGVRPKLYELNRYLPATSPTPADNKISALRGLLLEALAASPSLSLLPDTEVTRVLVSGPRATGVEVRVRPSWKHPAVLTDPHELKLPLGTTYTVAAQTVILAAGSLGSPTILLNSKIGGPAVGRGVVIHPSLPLVGEFEERIDATRGLTASVYVDAHAERRGFMFEAMPGSPNYVAMLVPGTGREVLSHLRRYRHMAGFGVMLVDTPHPDNRVRLIEGRPVVDYRLRPQDAERFRAGAAEALRTLFAAGARRVIVPSNEEGIPRVFERPEQAALLESHLRFVSGRTILTSAHMQGSLKLGADPSSGALAPDHRVWRAGGGRYENLYVVDGSVFPTSVGANPMQAIYTFARLVADRLAPR